MHPDRGGSTVTLAVVLFGAVLATGALARAAHHLSRRGSVVHRFAVEDGQGASRPDRHWPPVGAPGSAEVSADWPLAARLASDGPSRRWQPAEPPVRVAAALAEADLPVAPALAWTGWLGGLALAPLMAGLVGGPGLAGVALVGVGVGPLVVVRSRRGQADARLEQALPGALEAVARSLRSGASLRQAVAEAGAAAGTGRVLAAELSRAATEASQGASLVTALEAVGARRPVPGVRLGVAALCLGAETGGAQARAVDGVAATVRERLAVTAELRALSSQARISALVIGLAPVGFGAFAAATDPRTSQFLLHTTAGLILLTTGLVLDGLGWLWMQRLARVDL